METQSRKRKSPEQEKELSGFSLDELNQDLLERVLSWLPPSTLFRLFSVSKRWKSVASSATFHLACSQIPNRDPWFFMVNPHFADSVVFDSTDKNYKILTHPPLLTCNSIPVAASGGLICFHNAAGDFIISNPLSGSSRRLPSLDLSSQSQSLNAITMSSSTSSSYKLVLVYGELPNLSFRVYRSSSNCWEEDAILTRKFDNSMDSEDNMYFLSKAGDLVATNMQRSPSKQYSSVITKTDNGEEIVHFLSSSGTVVACNITTKWFFEYPRLLPVFSEYSIDVVECRGEMLAVVLSEFLETASLRVWRFDEETRFWVQIAAMPPATSHEFYGKKVDINCVGSGDEILICVNSSEICRYFLCDLVANKWSELPKCSVNGEAKDFMSAFSFEPRIEAVV